MSMRRSPDMNRIDGTHRLREDVEILKRATAFFVKENR
jgi:hypothetical protein